MQPIFACHCSACKRAVERSNDRLGALVKSVIERTSSVFLASTSSHTYSRRCRRCSHCGPTRARLLLSCQLFACCAQQRRHSNYSIKSLITERHCRVYLGSKALGSALCSARNSILLRAVPTPLLPYTRVSARLTGAHRCVAVGNEVAIASASGTECHHTGHDLYWQAN